MSASDAMWPFARRFLSFDEPSVKDTQLMKLHNSLPNYQQQSIALDEIDAVISSRNANNLLFSAAFALEDAKRFTGIAYEAWAYANRSIASVNAPIDESVAQAIARTGDELGLSPEAAQWCCRISALAVPWHLLSDSDVAQTQLVKRTLKRISQMRKEAKSREYDVKSAHLLLLECVSEMRDVLPSNILPRAILIVEGATEAILIPHIASLLGHSFARDGLMLVAAGGAKQVGKRFFQLRDIVRVPLYCLLDADAQEQAELIADALRDRDQLHVLTDGEIEDTFADQFFTKVINKFLQDNLVSGDPVNVSEFARGASARKRTATAQAVLRRHASIDFDKVEFARLALEYLRAPGDVPKELRMIVDTIMQSLKQKRH